MKDRIFLETAAHVATVVLNRPEKRNALDPAMFEALVEAGERLKAQRNIRAVVLRGAGPAFSAGVDLSALPEMARLVHEAGGLMRRSHGPANLFQQASLIWREIPVPVIAAVHGHVLGGAFQIMLGADIRVAAPGCRFSIMEGRWGLVPDMGGMVLMRRVARSDVIRRLVYTAEEFSAEQALEWGFVTEIGEDPQARAQELAGIIATRSPDAVRAAKALINESDFADPETILLAESRHQESLIGTPNQTEAVMAGLQNATPRFRD